MACRKKKPSSNTNTLSSKDSDQGEQSVGPFCNLSTSTRKGKTMRTLPHHTYEMFRDKHHKLSSLPDTGAEMVVAGLPQLHRLGITKKELIPLSNGISAADNSGLGLLGGVLVNISGQCDNGTVISTKQLCYIAENIDCLFLSRQACR